MTTFKAVVANLNPIRAFSRYMNWRTARREAQMKRWENMERSRIATEEEAKSWERSISVLGLAHAESALTEAWRNINPLTPDAKETRERYEQTIFRCRRQLETERKIAIR